MVRGSELSKLLDRFQLCLFLSVSARPASLDVVAKSTSTNVHRSRVTTVAAVPICRKDIVVNVRLVSQARIVKTRRAIVSKIPVRHVPCARMNRVMAITHVCVAADTRATIVTSQSIHAQQMAIRARTEHRVWHCNKDVSSATACRDGLANCVK